MAGINWRNMALIILSVLLAILLWIYASNEQNPVNDQILSIQLYRLNPPKDAEISGIPANVSIRVQGPRTQVGGLTPADFQAVVDLSGATEGNHYIPVKVNSPSGIQVTQVTPNRVYVVVDGIVERQVGVAASFKGSPAKGYIAQEPSIQPSTVILRGPRSKIGAINQVKVTVEIESATAAVDQTLPVSPGQNGITVSPQSVRVSVPVIPLPSRTVAVKPRITGDPAKGYAVPGYTVKPETVNVVAPSESLPAINWVETEKVDIAGADRDVIVKMGLVMPAGAVEIRPAAVDLTVQVRKASAPDTGPAPTAEPPR